MSLYCKTFTAVIVAVTKYARVFVTTISLQPNLLFAGKVGAYRSGALTGLHSTGRLLAMPNRLEVNGSGKHSSLL